MKSYKVTKNFSLVIAGDSVPVNPFEARLLKINTKQFQHSARSISVTKTLRSDLKRTHKATTLWSLHVTKDQLKQGLTKSRVHFRRLLESLSESLSCNKAPPSKLTRSQPVNTIRTLIYKQRLIYKFTFNIWLS